MGPVISEGARKSILDYIETGKQEGRLLAGGERADGRRLLHRARRSSPTSMPKARIFQEEIFGPVLAVTKAKDFDDALRIGERLAVRTDRRGLLEQSGAPASRRARSSSSAISISIANARARMVGAHPFGGFNMSGTDSKAGGRDYLLLFLQAKAIAEKHSADIDRARYDMTFTVRVSFRAYP